MRHLWDALALPARGSLLNVDYSSLDDQIAQVARKAIRGLLDSGKPLPKAPHPGRPHEQWPKGRIEQAWAVASAFKGDISVAKANRAWADPFHQALLVEAAKEWKRLNQVD